jgi:hypothetical protein
VRRSFVAQWCVAILGSLSAAVSLSTCSGVLSTEAVRLVGLVRSGNPEFVPFLFPGCKSV